MIGNTIVHIRFDVFPMQRNMCKNAFTFLNIVSNFLQIKVKRLLKRLAAPKWNLQNLNVMVFNVSFKNDTEFLWFLFEMNTQEWHPKLKAASIESFQ